MLEIRFFQTADWPLVQEIYQQGIDTKIATFQEKAKAWEAWDRTTLEECRLVAVENDEIVGWAALSSVSSRAVYAGVAEVSIYVAADHHGQGIGKRLLMALVEEFEEAGIWTLQAGIFPENTASIMLHKKCGFREVGLREKIGHMEGKWRDVLLLERRSKVVGI